jgi:glycosyltransferase involved in cell wall biosynthesis
MRALKIALVSRSYWEDFDHDESHEGGATQQLAEAIAKLGHEIIVLTQSADVGKYKQIQVGTLETWATPRNRARGLFTGLRDSMANSSFAHHRLYSDAGHLREFLDKRGPFDVVWAANEAPDGLVVATAAKMGVRLPPVLVQVQKLRQRFDKGEPVFIEKKMFSLVFDAAKRLLVSSDMMATDLAEYASSKLSGSDLKAKVHVVHPNIKKLFLRAMDDKAFPDSKPDRVLYLGDVNQASGAMVFLSGISKTEAGSRNGTFVVAGDFTEYNRRYMNRWEKAQEDARLLLTGARMEFLGHVSSYEIARQIKLASVVVVPALYNGFSRSVVESLVLGRPVVVTEKVGSWPLVQDYQCGFIVPPRDPASLAKAIDLALGHALAYAENVAEVASRLAHEYSPAAIALQVERHLSEIAMRVK